ncbi:hypothetical protein GJ496_009434 [Pomphorhynchus laevis]|nr:hypothetical protein GJ496_009434 [Pomphorhynchus laevis]
MRESYTDNKAVTRIQLLGDPGVGKTSLILSLVREQFFDPSPSILSSSSLKNSDSSALSPNNNNCLQSIIPIAAKPSSYYSSSRIRLPDKVNEYCDNHFLSPPISLSPSSLQLATSSTSTISQDIYLPGEITLNCIPCVLADCDVYLHRHDEDKLLQIVDDADVICIVFSNEDIQSYQNVIDMWIPFIVDCFHQKASDLHLSINEVAKPVLLIANKYDLCVNNDDCPNFLDNNKNSNSERSLDKLMETYNWIEYYLNCSALTMYNVVELFYCAQKCVIHPISTLYDTFSNTLHERSLQAIRHIFHILDRRHLYRIEDYSLLALQDIALISLRLSSLSSSNDAYSVDQFNRASNLFELDLLEKYSSDATLNLDQLKCIKRIILSSDQHFDVISNKLEVKHQHTEVTSKYLDHNEFTEEGFIKLFELLINCDRMETVWAFLNVFFDDRLNFVSSSENQLKHEIDKDLVSDTHKFSTEFSENAVDFLRHLYCIHSSAMNVTFKWPTVQSINKFVFSQLNPAPNPVELVKNVRLSNHGSTAFACCNTKSYDDVSDYVSEEQFVLWWLYQIESDPFKSLRWLSQLGFDFWQMADIIRSQRKGSISHEYSSAFKIIRHCKSDKNSPLSVSAINCAVLSEPLELGRNILTSMLCVSPLRAMYYQTDWVISQLKISCCCYSKQIRLIFRLFNSDDDNTSDHSCYHDNYINVEGGDKQINYEKNNTSLRYRCSRRNCPQHQAAQTPQPKYTKIIHNQLLLLICDLSNESSCRHVIKLFNSLLPSWNYQHHSYNLHRDDCQCNHHIHQHFLTNTTDIVDDHSSSQTINISTHPSFILVIALNDDICDEKASFVACIRNLGKVSSSLSNSTAAIMVETVFVQSKSMHQTELVNVIYNKIEIYLNKYCCSSFEINSQQVSGPKSTDSSSFVSSMPLSSGYIFPFWKLSLVSVFNGACSILNTSFSNLAGIVAVKSNGDGGSSNSVLYDFFNYYSYPLQGSFLRLNAGYYFILSSSAIFGFLAIFVLKSLHRQNQIFAANNNFTNSIFS